MNDIPIPHALFGIIVIIALTQIATDLRKIRQELQDLNRKIKRPPV